MLGIYARYGSYCITQDRDMEVSGSTTDFMVILIYGISGILID